MEMQTPSKERIMKTKYEDMGQRPFLLVPVIDERENDVPIDAIGSLVYGYLLYRARKGEDASRTAIATSLRLDKKATNHAVGILLRGAAEEDRGTIRAVEPKGDAQRWFRLMKPTVQAEWYERFVYDRVYLPRSSSTLSVRTNRLFWHLVKLGQPVDRMPGCLQVGGQPSRFPQYLTTEYLSRGLGCYRRTVARGLARLRELGLITVQQNGKKRFVVGVPPVGRNAHLWRVEWKGTNEAEDPVVEVTAESLFGVPSGEALQPSVSCDAGVALYMRAIGVRGQVAADIETLIVKNEIPPREWRPLLEEADRDHSRNQEDQPGKFKAKHCGFLFESMLKDHIEKEKARCYLAGERSPMTHSDMEADTLLSRLRMPPDGRKLLRQAVKAEHFELRDGRVVPCRLSWGKVVEVLKAAGKDFAAFKKGIAAAIFKGKPDSDWYDAWMRAEQIPAQNDKPLESKKLDARERNLVRSRAAMIAKRKYGEQEDVARKHLVNDLIRLACWQTPGRSVTALTDALEDVGRVLFTTPGDSSSLDPDPLDPLLCG
jgi:hypothetical protein